MAPNARRDLHNLIARIAGSRSGDNPRPGQVVARVRKRGGGGGGAAVACLPSLVMLLMRRCSLL